MNRYYDVHCSFDNGEGYSIPVKVVSDEPPRLSKVVQHCVDNKLFSDSYDIQFVDSITEIDYEEYLDLKGC